MYIDNIDCILYPSKNSKQSNPRAKSIMTRTSQSQINIQELACDGSLGFDNSQNLVESSI